MIIDQVRKLKIGDPKTQFTVLISCEGFTLDKFESKGEKSVGTYVSGVRKYMYYVREGHFARP